MYARNRGRGKVMEDRRKNPRYPLSAPVRHQSLDRRDRTEYPGELTNMNSCYAYIRSAERPQPGKLIKAFIEWPVLLDGRIPLQLICNGVVRRVDDYGFAFELRKHEFRTKRTINIVEGRTWRNVLTRAAKTA